MQTAILVLAIGVFAAAAWSDLRARHIPNALPLAIAALGLARLAVIGNAYAALWTVVAAALLFAILLLQWSRNLLGGGDVKLLAAAALLVGSHQLLPFLFLMSLLGAALAVAVLAAGRFGGPAGLLLPFPGAVEASARPSVPYGVAIAAAGIIILVLQFPIVK